MSLKSLFSSKVKQVTKEVSNETITEEIESVDLYDEYIKKENTFLPPIKFDDPTNFAFYGSAEKYYSDAIENIYKTYPYDGSQKEKYQWINEATYLEKWFFENLYPKSTGYINLSVNGWGTKVGSLVNGYGEPLNKEYIQIKGGPNIGSYSNNGIVNAFTSSNFYDEQYNRLSNLRYNLIDGVTVEFWLKKDSFDTSKTEKEVIFDLWNGELSSSSKYGRLTIELTSSTTSPFLVTAQSGTVGIFKQEIGTYYVTTSSLTNWHHYAVSFINNQTSGIDVKFYQDGLLKTTNTYGSGLFGEISGSLIANIGSLRTAPSGSISISEGWGKLSGSLDEFRYWKNARNSKQIYRNWSTVVHGGTNTDDANTDLGVYFKFNEGITTQTAIDSRVLDYSGRLSNGTWTGYSINSRNTGSAINEYGNKFTEYGDPIIYSFHPDVESITNEYTLSGSYYDSSNAGSLYKSIPSWIVEEDTSNELLQLTQILSSYLDTLYLQIKHSNNIKNFYDSKAQDVSQTSLVREALQSIGIVTPEIFINSNLIEEILNKNEVENYELSLTQIKNLIYSNVYSNALAIFKSKGTEKSFRNLLNCFGINEDLVKINLYSNNIEFELKDNFYTKRVKKKLINFSNLSNINSVIYQYADASNSNSVGYISGSSNLSYIPFTIESEIYFPLRNNTINDLTIPNVTISSLFGTHTANSNSSDLTWPVNDYFDLRVYAIKEDINKNNAYFMLSSSNSAIPTLTSSLYYDVYNNEKWNFVIRLKNNNYPLSDVVSGSSNSDYTIEFIGINATSDTIIERFNLSSSLPKADALNILSSNKRLYVGADRTNFTGSVLHSTDIKVSNIKYWMEYLNDNLIEYHAKDIENYGSSNPTLPNNLFTSALTGSNNLSYNNLLLNWSFNDLTASDINGQFVVNDLSSGSISNDFRNKQWLSNLVERQHTGFGYEFVESSELIYDNDYLISAKQRLPEIINSSDMINILQEDDTLFVKSTRPSRFLTYLEKSMYQTISEEMLNMFGTIVEFNNLIGDPVNKYRIEYKELGKLRQLFFEKLQNEPSLDKYLDYYKWIDSSIGIFLQQLIPASSESDNGLMNVIESHVLERNKYQHKFPTIEFKAPILEAGVETINKNLYNWRLGYRPISNLENENCFYWNAKAERDTSPISSSVSANNFTRTKILDATLSALNRSFTTTYRLDVNENKQLKGGVNFEANKNIDFSSIALAPHGPLDSDSIVNVPANYLVSLIESTSSLIQDCQDVINPNKKIKYYFTTVQGRDFLSSSLGYGEILSSKIALPLNVISGSDTSGYQSQVSSEFMSGAIITNIHNDTYGSMNEIPVQGPFTNAWVGGRQSRHVNLNTGGDNYLNRPEAWKILLGIGSFSGSYETALGIVGADYPFPEGNPDDPSYPVRAHLRATYLREETAKRPINIRNIQSTTGSAVLGNYSNTYEVLHSFGSTTNNRNILEITNPNNITELESVVRTNTTTGKVDFQLQTRTPNKSIVITRFSSPGERRTMSVGYMNKYAEEISPYNALPFKNREIIGTGRGNRDNRGDTSDSKYIPEIVSGSRRDLNSLVAYYTDFGGTASGSSGLVASLHKTNRNPILKATLTSSYDNGFITHQIPQKDTGYAWITASLSGNITDASFGHILSTFTTPSSSTSIYKSLNLQSSSIYSTGINVGVFEDVVDYNNNTLGSSYDIRNYTSSVYFTSNVSEAFNALILMRNSQYQYPTFKQIRNKENKILNKFINTNIFSTLDISGNIKNFSEPVVESSNYPILTNIDVNSSTVTLKHTFENNIQNFSNKNLNNVLAIPNHTDKEQPFDRILDNHSSRNIDLTQTIYSKRIYPQSKNTFSSTSRRREQFDFNWRDSQAERVENNVTSSFGQIIPTQSMWPLDGKLNFDSNWNYGSEDGLGELQNNYNFFTSSIYQSTASANYFYKNTFNHAAASFRAKSGVNITYPGFNNNFSSYQYRNNANWDVPLQSGKTPFNNNYDTWHYSASLQTKDFSILPEYIVSDKVVDLSRNTRRDFNITNNVGSFTIRGGTYTSSVVSSIFEEKYLYSNNIDILLDISDNLRNSYFNFNNSEVGPITNIKLKFDGLIKFLPYDGLYPVQRTLQIANQFSQSYGDNIQKGILQADGTISSSFAPESIVRNMYMPMFAPGILYNSIKSGIAVDFPILTQSVESVNRYFYTQWTFTPTPVNYQINNNEFDLRLPFQTLIEPENYLKELTIFDMNPDPNLNITGAIATWNGNGTPYYKYMINNFLSETSEFFLKEKSYSYLKSKPINEVIINSSDLNKEYRCLIKIRKTTNENIITLNNQFVTSSDTRSRYPRPQKFNNETITMYSMPTAFGPPCAGGYAVGLLSRTGTLGIIDSTNGYNAPFTPPYYDGEGWSLLTFKPTLTGSYTLSEIFSQLTSSYLRYEFDYQDTPGNGLDSTYYIYGTSSTADGPQGYNNLNNNAMQINSSIGLLNVTENNEWIIKPWYETPILDFNPENTGYTRTETSTNADYLIPYGMWHQYGVEPKDNAGIYLSVDDIPKSYIKRGQETTIANPNGSWASARIGNTSLTSSLLKLLGNGESPFENKEIKLGVIADTKEISETVIAIPFVTNANGEKQYFSANETGIKAWLASTNEYNPSAREERLFESINVNELPQYVKNQAKVMADYVIPPQYDFLYNRNTDPVLMYCFEFKKYLSKQDLIDIWQNVIPDCGLSNNIEIQSIEQDVDISSLGITNINQLDNLRWMIFKVKKKAKKSWKETYYDNIDSRKDTSIPYYTFNWPYDYFSLVETGKLTITLDAKKS